MLIIPSLAIAYLLTYSSRHFDLLVSRFRANQPQIRRIPRHPQNPIFVDKYRIIREVYNQPMSELHEVRDESNDKSYLLKTIKDKSTYEPGIVQAVAKAYEDSESRQWVALPLEILEDDNHYYEVLPYFKGDTLFDIMSLNPDGIQGALLETFAKDLLQLVQPLHCANPPLVHRDISPRNVLLESNELRLILLDFSNAIEPNSARENDTLGLPGFSPPEQYDGIYSPANDVYSIGALLFYLNSGGVWPATAQERLYRNENLALKGRNRNRFRKAVERMLTLDPKDRFQNVMDVLKYINRRRSTEMFSLDPIGVFRLIRGDEITMSYHGWERKDI